MINNESSNRRIPTVHISGYSQREWPEYVRVCKINYTQKAFYTKHDIGWIVFDNNECKCSICNKNVDKQYNYCPYCGTKFTAIKVNK